MTVSVHHLVIVLLTGSVETNFDFYCIFFVGVEYPGFSSQQGQDMSLLRRAQAGSGSHQTSYPLGTRGNFPEVIAVGIKLTTNLYLVLWSRMVVELYLNFFLWHST